MKKTFLTLLWSTALTTCLISTAQAQAPKLAVASVEASADLIKKFPAEGSADTAGASPQGQPDLQGVWKAVVNAPAQPRTKREAPHPPAPPVNWVLTITKSKEGALHATILNTAVNLTWTAESVNSTGTKVVMGFPVNGATNILDGGVDPTSGALAAVWKSDKGPQPITFNRADPVQAPGFRKKGPPTSNPSGSMEVTLAEAIHALDAQLVDRITSAHVCTLVEDSDFKQAIPQSVSSLLSYNFKDAGSVERCKSAGISYILVTTLMDLQNQTLAVAQGVAANQMYQEQRQSQQRSGSVPHNKNQNQVERQSRVQANASQTRSQPANQKVQVFRMTVRCRLFEATSGTVLDSVSRSFTNSRTYNVLAQTDQSYQAGDLLEASAKATADWAALRVGETINPIKVLDKNEKEITLNRGEESGLQPGQNYNVFTYGKELADPDTKEILGREENLVGRVSIGELQPKFCKARILEDKGIVLGSFLRRKAAN